MIFRVYYVPDITAGRYFSKYFEQGFLCYFKYYLSKIKSATGNAVYFGSMVFVQKSYFLSNYKHFCQKNIT